MRSFLTLVLLSGALLPLQAFAAVTFTLGEMPEKPTLQSCRKWATSQKDDDTLRAWGRTKRGGTSREVAVLRLTLSCLGDDTPEIVMFGTSKGFDEAYCSADTHKGDAICKKR